MGRALQGVLAAMAAQAGSQMAGETIATSADTPVSKALASATVRTNPCR